MRISSKVVVPPPCQRKSQAMANTSGSDSEMQRFESSRPELRVVANPNSEMQRFESCRPNEPASPSPTVTYEGQRRAQMQGWFDTDRSLTKAVRAVSRSTASFPASTTRR